MPISGRSGSAGRPKARSRSALHSAFPERSCAEYVLAMCGSWRGSHSVQDPDQVRGARAHDAVEPVAHLRGLYLPRVLGRDRAHRLGEEDAALHVAHAAVVLQRVAAQVPGQTEDVHGLGADVPLVGDVVDGEDRGRAVERGVVPVERFEVHGQEPGMPVVGVEDVGPLAAAAEVLDGGTGEEREAEMVVAVAVEERPVEEGRVLHEDDTQPAAEGPPVEAGAAAHVVHGDVDRSRELAGRERDLAVARDEDRDLVAGPGQGLGQRGGRVGQAAGLGEGRQLGADVADMQLLRGRHGDQSKLPD
jgi:hypothetical protein